MTVIFYDRNAGVGEFYNTLSQDNLSLLKSYSGWRTSWTHIIPGYAFENSQTDLLFYDSSSGAAEFYTEVQGNINLLKSTTYRAGWTHIVPGLFAQNGNTALLFYNSQSGLAEFYSTDGQGNINLLSSNTGWRKSWAQIVWIEEVVQ